MGSEAVRVFRQAIREEMAGQDEVVPPAVARRVLASFEDDPAFLVRYYRETAYGMVHALVLQVAADTRRRVTYVTDPGANAAAFARLAARKCWTNRLEHAGGRMVRFGNMRADDLALWIAEREQRGRTEYQLAALGRRILPALGGRRIEEVFEEGDLLALAAEVGIAGAGVPDTEEGVAPADGAPPVPAAGGQERNDRHVPSAGADGLRLEGSPDGSIPAQGAA